MARSLVGLILVLVVSVTASAANVGFNPGGATVVNGSTFSMDLIGTGFNSGDLDGGGINFSYDASVVQVISVSVDTTTWEFFSDNGTIDNILGSVTGIQFNSFESRTGDLLFATVNFMAIGVDTTQLGLSEFLDNPFATGGAPYSGVAFDQNGSIMVAAVPVPAAVWLFGSALGILGWVGRKLHS